MILAVFKCRNSSLDCYDTVKKYNEKMMEQSITIKFLMSVRRSNSTMMNSGQLTQSRTSSMLHIGRLINDIRSGGQKKRFQYCLNPNYLHRLFHLRAIQGRSGSIVNPALQDNVLLPEGCTEYNYHVGIGKELRSLVNHGLISGRVSLRTGRQAVFFTVVNPMDNQEGLGELPMRLVTNKKRATQKYLDTLYEYSLFGAI